MGRLFKAFFFKLSRDLAFRITLIIGAGLAFLMTGLFLLIDIGTGGLSGGEEMPIRMLTGPNMLLSSFSPVDNFGLAIPINLITFICLEFSQGTIRNKIIAGHSKFKIYTSLFLSGLVLTFSLLIVYVGICTALGSAFGGFDLDKPVMNMSSLSALAALGSYIDGAYIAKMLLVVLVVYIAIVSFTVFFAALFRAIGPCIPVVIILLMVLSVGGSMISMMAEALDGLEGVDLKPLVTVIKIVDPLYVISGGGSELSVVVVNEQPRYYLDIETSAFVATIINNLVYAAIFYLGGAFLFANRDVK